MHQHFQTELREDSIKTKGLVFLIVAGLLSIFLYKNQGMDVLFILIGVSIITVLVIAGYGVFTQKLIIRIEGDVLYLDKYLFGKMYSKEYPVSNMSSINFHKHVQSDSYTSASRVRVLGFDLTPESAKNYYYHKEIVSFSFEGGRIELGKWKQPFNGEELVKILRSMKDEM